jgi:hypothetical protein
MQQFQSALEDGDVVRQDFCNMPDCPQVATARLSPNTPVSALVLAAATSNQQEHNMVTKWTKDQLGRAAVHQSGRGRAVPAHGWRTRGVYSSLWCEAATAPTAIGSNAAGKATPASSAAKRPRKPLVADQGKREKARNLLAPVYGWFTEGLIRSI